MYGNQPIKSEMEILRLKLKRHLSVNSQIVSYKEMGQDFGKQ